MTPGRKELADTCLRLAEDRGHAIAPAVRCALRLAADALRQEPSVEEVAAIIHPHAFKSKSTFSWVEAAKITARAKAQAILATISKGRDG